MRFAVLPSDGGDDTTSAELRRSGAVVDGVAVVTHVIRAADIAASLPRAVGGAASGNRGAKGGSGSGAVAMGGVTALECLPRRLLVRYCPRCLLLAPSVLTYLVRVHVFDTRSTGLCCQIGFADGTAVAIPIASPTPPAATASLIPPWWPMFHGERGDSDGCAVVPGSPDGQVGPATIVPVAPATVDIAAARVVAISVPSSRGGDSGSGSGSDGGTAVVAFAVQHALRGSNVTSPHVVALARSGSYAVWDAQDGTVVCGSVDVAASPAACVAMPGPNSPLVVTQGDGCVRVFDMSLTFCTLPLFTPPPSHAAIVEAAALAVDGEESMYVVHRSVPASLLPPARCRQLRESMVQYMCDACCEAQHGAGTTSVSLSPDLLFVPLFLVRHS